MLELKKISKTYETKNLKQKAIDEISINFRCSEFVSILGPSGSGKTTLLNIIGGLDHYDKGDLIINEVSTKKYKDRDWDSYRNHRIGFVFQSYNLISHQTILKNVELALTLIGVSKKERIRRAKDALCKVGLEKHINKKPNELSGGERQRVAIARAIVNNPDIILLDEPTGALDSETSKQIMNLLVSISKDKLVIMVTHNSDIAYEYSNRIIKLKDGVIIDDSNPYNGKINTKGKINKAKNTSMNFITALSLSLNNLMTKKGRTFLTSFAGSIGIIGIALILSLSNGVQEYINKTERETLATYPLTIKSDAIDYKGMIDSVEKENKVTCEENKICTKDDITNNPSMDMTTSFMKNNLLHFKESLDSNYKNIKDYVTDIQYTYDLNLNVYSNNLDNGIVKISSLNSINSFGMMDTNIFKELINNDELLDGQYDVLSGHMPNNYNEVVLVVDENNRVPMSLMYALNIIDKTEKIGDSKNFSYDYLLDITYKLILNTDYYVKENGIWKDNSSSIEYMKKIIKNGIDIKIVGIIKIRDDAVEASSGYIGYTHDLTTYLIDNINKSDIAKEQLSNKNINILTGKPFNESDTYENNLKMLGICNLSDPDTINIYPIDYDNKEKIENIITDYNKENADEYKIIYTDYVGILMNSVTSIIDVITYVLIAFVGISLIVSSIMISIITYISVLERTKEIGILRSIGASKKDVKRVFNAETIIEGFIAGLFGILVTILLCFPINSIVNNLTGVNNIAVLPMYGAVSLIIISIILTFIAGLIPSRMASKKDPVIALRSE